ncbi:MAG: TonB-dependent receptor [Acidobacteriaceae bacterium]|nr:TonB-dependent receptor [Acidobacteriaceae bacterium]MBV9766394.1 TonB-dependent receptor [Acidobacteriaceae bacterium]
MKPADCLAKSVIIAVLALRFASAQFETGELRVSVIDATGLPLPSAITLVSELSRTRREFNTNDAGQFTFQHLPFGMYHLAVDHPGFAPYSSVIEIHSELPRDIRVQLNIKAASTEVVVSDTATLIDPHRTGVTYGVGSQQIQEQQSAIPGRGLLDLVDQQPGWLFEANAVPHPRGSENQTLFVIDGVPMDENRSPAFAPALETSEVSSMSVITGNIPAEYGRKLGGVVELTTSQDIRQGFHGSAELGGGSFGTETGLLSGAYGWNRSALTVAASAEHTNRYLDPPVLGNYTNTGNSHGISAAYDQDLSDFDRIYLAFHRRQASFEVPNENLQEAAGQRQDRNAPEDLGQAAWTHEFSAQLLLNLRAVVEDLSANLWSNAFSTPIVAFQQRRFRRSYLNSSLSAHKGRHDFKFGADAIYAPVTEALKYQITDPSFFDPGTPLTFDFLDHRLDREQAAWAQDTFRVRNLTISAGLRWDHYSLVVHDHAVSPRFGVAWYLPSADLVLRFSYDRVFQTPAIENLLLASSPQVDQLDPLVLRIPVPPSRGNYIEAGFSQSILKKTRLDVSFYRRSFANYADDDVFLNTGINFPIAFHSAQIHGIDVKLDLPKWGNLSGFLSYSNMLGIAQLPVVGGLFLGSDAVGVLGVTSTFPISQDQRNTARARLRYQIHPRVWIASSTEYGSGLPVEINGDADLNDLEAQYGAQIISRVNFSAGRVRPTFSLDVSAAVDLWTHEKSAIRLQGEIENLTDKLNVINFAGLFSGTAIGPPRSGNVRLQFEF